MTIKQELIQKLKAKEKRLKDKKSIEYKITKRWLKELEKLEHQKPTSNE